MLPVITALAGAASSFFGDSSAPSGPNTSGGAFAPSGMIIGPKVVGRGNATQNADNRASASQTPAGVPSAPGVVYEPGMTPRTSEGNPDWLSSPVILWSTVAAVAVVLVLLLIPSKRKKNK